MPKKINWQGGYVKNPFADIPTGDWKFLSDFADKVKDKVAFSAGDYTMVKKIFEENKLQLPTTQKRTADYISSINEAIDQNSLNAEMDKNIHS